MLRFIKKVLQILLQIISQQIDTVSLLLKLAVFTKSIEIFKYII